MITAQSPWRRWLAVLVLAFAAAPAGAQRGVSGVNRHDLVTRQFDAKVVRVADADTLEVIVSGERTPIRMRLEGVDAPEQGEVFSREATLRLRELTFDKTVRVTGKGIDRYGRLIARVLADGVDASGVLVRAGLACHAYAYDSLLAREEAAARAARAGFWSATIKPACVTRTAFSARQAHTGATPNNESVTPRPEGATSISPRDPRAFRANTTSGLYHARSCPNYTCRNCTREFATEAAAQAAGFKPAGDCLKK